MAKKINKNKAALGNRIKEEIYLRTMDECFRLPVPLTKKQIIKKCQERVNSIELKLGIPLSDQFQDKTFYNYLEKLKNESFSKLGISLPLESKLNGSDDIQKPGKINSKDSNSATYAYTDKSFTLFDRVLNEVDRRKIQKIGAYLKNVSSRWQNDMLEDISQGLEILQLDLNTTQPKVQYELPYHLDENQLQTFKLLYQAIDKQQVIEFEYDRHNAPGEDYFEGKTEEEIRKIRYKVVMSPYFLKQSQNRWYLLGKSHEEYLEFEDYLMPVSIERLRNVEIKLNIPYLPNPGITLKDYYRNLIGITMEKNQEKKDLWFVTTRENIELIKNMEPKYVPSQKDTESEVDSSQHVVELNSKELNTTEKEVDVSGGKTPKGTKPEKSVFSQIFGEPTNDKKKNSMNKSYKVHLELGSFNEKEHQLWELKSKPTIDVLNFIKNNPDEVKLLYPIEIMENDFFFENIRYLVIQVSNDVSISASNLGFDLIPGESLGKPTNEDSPARKLREKFKSFNLDLVFGEGTKDRGEIVLICRESTRVDSQLINLLSNPEIKSKVGLLNPENLLRKAISPFDVKNIVLEVNRKFAHYIISKPFHESQKLLDFGQIKELLEKTDNGFQLKYPENKDCVYFYLNLIPNFELENQILAKGDQIKVIYPISLRDKIAKRVEKMYQLYVQSKMKKN